jgi:hypothetical protein
MRTVYCKTCEAPLDVQCFEDGMPAIKSDSDGKFRAECDCGEVAEWNESGERIR